MLLIESKKLRKEMKEKKEKKRCLEIGLNRSG